MGLTGHTTPTVLGICTFAETREHFAQIIVSIFSLLDI